MSYRQERTPTYSQGFGVSSRFRKPGKTSDILAKDILSEGDVHLLMRRINRDYPDKIDHEIAEAIYSKEDGYKLTPEQIEKGRKWLEKHRKDMGYREESVMDDFKEIRLVGTAPGETNNYQYPYYRVIANDGSSFEYKVEGGELHILG